jgi:hypothetical protein
LHRRALDSSLCPCNYFGVLRWSLLSSLHVVIFVCFSEPTVLLFYIIPPAFPLLAFHFVWTRKGFSNLLQFGDCKTPGLFMRQSGPPLSPNYSITSSNLSSSSNPLSRKLSPIHRHNANLDGACSYVFFVAIFLFYSILTLRCYLFLPQVVSKNIIFSI